MKKIATIRALASTLLLTTVMSCAPVAVATAYAGGLEDRGLADPVVTPPARADHFTGFYLGVSATSSKTVTNTTTRQECYKDYNGELFLLPCDNDAFTEFGYVPVIETIVEGSASSSSNTEIGGFVGYRAGDALIYGVEAGKSGLTYVEAQIGINADRVLPFASLGASDEGASYGLGIDVALGRNVLVGVAHREADEGYTSLRVGLTF